MKKRAAYLILSEMALRQTDGVEVSLTVWQSLATIAKNIGLKKQAKIAKAVVRDLLSYDRNQLSFKEFLQGGKLQ